MIINIRGMVWTMILITKSAFQFKQNYITCFREEGSKHT